MNKHGKAALTGIVYAQHSGAKGIRMLEIRMQLYAVQPKLRYAVGLGVYIFKIGMQRT